MKLLASLLIAVSLALGAIAATTAYAPRLGAVDPQVELLTLNAPAGRKTVAQEDVARPYVRPQPIAARETKLTADVIDELRAAGVQRVRVKEFAWARWDKAWLFAIAVVGLLAGAGIIRMERRRTLRAIMQAGAAAGTQGELPEVLLRGAADDLASLRRDIPGLKSDHDRLHAILERITEVQQERFEPFVLARPLIVAKLGMAGYAQLMDRFAAAERQVNRAWSAAADRVLDESEYCLEQAMTPLGEAIARLG